MILGLYGAEKAALKAQGINNGVKELLYIAALKSALLVSKEEWLYNDYTPTLRILLKEAGWEEGNQEREWNGSRVDPESEIGQCIELLKDKECW